MRRGSRDRHVRGTDGRALPVDIRRDRRARRLTLRVDQSSGDVRLVLPPRTPIAEGLDFAQLKITWIERQLDELPVRVPFTEGARVPVLGIEHEIRHDPLARRGVWREAGEIRVSGFAEHMPRRVGDYLKQEARRELESRARAKAEAVKRQVQRITLRDTKTRWGSCSSEGSLNFSWRLIFAPEPVLDYVVAHEVAHLVHMNHSARFWKLVAKLTPELDGPRDWLRDEGNQLLRYG